VTQSDSTTVPILIRKVGWISGHDRLYLTIAPESVLFIGDGNCPVHESQIPGIHSHHEGTSSPFLTGICGLGRTCGGGICVEFVWVAKGCSLLNLRLKEGAIGDRSVLRFSPSLLS